MPVEARRRVGRDHVGQRAAAFRRFGRENRGSRDSGGERCRECQSSCEFQASLRCDAQHTPQTGFLTPDGSQRQTGRSGTNSPARRATRTRTRAKRDVGGPFAPGNRPRLAAGRLSASASPLTRQGSVSERELLGTAATRLRQRKAAITMAWPRPGLLPAAPRSARRSCVLPAAASPGNNHATAPPEPPNRSCRSSLLPFFPNSACHGYLGHSSQSSPHSEPVRLGQRLRLGPGSNSQTSQQRS